ncbi:MAG TPA: class I SAM-dependent methyltransferase [Polyangiaceae bacterium]|jgi:hypothetical protein|nr:class I SAM-dependent methyltransferase [Polyangiaceae bacterium]
MSEPIHQSALQPGAVQPGARAFATGETYAAVQAIYSEEYAALYPSLYIQPWAQKHALNVANLTRLLSAAPAIAPTEHAKAQPTWLDLACGQAWHFRQFPHRAHMLGVDSSAAQLMRAGKGAPWASFLQADIAGLELEPQSFDLITNFWAGYAYLGSHDRIGSLFTRATEWLKPGGSLYFEALVGRDLQSFNRSQFAQKMGFAVVPLSSDYSEWRYEDAGGSHVMTSPDLEFFLELLRPRFDDLQTHHDGAFMTHVIATGRRD